MQEGLGLAFQALLGGIEEGAWVLWAGERPLLLHISLSGLKTYLDYSNGHIPQASEHQETGRALLTWFTAAISHGTQNSARRYLLSGWVGRRVAECANDEWVGGVLVGGWVNGWINKWADGWMVCIRLGLGGFWQMD